MRDSDLSHRGGDFAEVGVGDSAENGRRRSGRDDQLVRRDDAVAAVRFVGIGLAEAAKEISLQIVNLSDIRVESPQPPIERQAQRNIARFLDAAKTVEG